MLGRLDRYGLSRDGRRIAGPVVVTAELPPRTRLSDTRREGLLLRRILQRNHLALVPRPAVALSITDPDRPWRYLELFLPVRVGRERVAGNGDFICVHDYHLMMLAENLRARGVIERLAYFHHIPFPAPDTFETLPWRSEVLRALMRFDSLGFQTPRDRRNFVESLHRCLPGVQVSGVGERLRVRFEDH